MRVIVADEHQEVRSALRVLFEQEQLELVGEADDAKSLFAAVSRHTADVLLLDWELLGAGTPVAIHTIRSLAPALRIVARSSIPEARGPALSDGADVFVTKADSPEQLLRAIEKAAGLGAGTAGTQMEER
jgi:two-component system invasion response regulator UvrY